jgi:hypothetical protein
MYEMVKCCVAVAYEYIFIQASSRYFEGEF